MNLCMDFTLLLLCGVMHITLDSESQCQVTSCAPLDDPENGEYQSAQYKIQCN